MAMRRRRGIGIMRGTREPHLWLRSFGVVTTINSAGPLQSGVAFDMNSLDTGIDAQRTVKRLLLKFVVEVVGAVLNQLVRIFIMLVKRKLGEAAENASFSTTGSRQGDVLWSNVYLVHIPIVGARFSLEALLGHEVQADVKAMRKLDVTEELRIEVFADTGVSGALNAGSSVDVGFTTSALVQRTRR